MTKVEALTVRQAAVQLRCTIPYLYSLLHAERMAGAYMVDGEWRLPLAAVKEYQMKRSRRAKPVRGESAHGMVEASA